MAAVFHASQLNFIQKQSPIPEFCWHTSSNLSENSRQFEFEIRSLDPGSFSYPYHFHRKSEELFVILSGKAILRTPEGLQELTEGDVVFFQTGPQGAHQLYNHTSLPCRFLDLGARVELDICEYPDSGKINILPEEEVYQTEDRVNYYLNEDAVKEKWKELYGGLPMEIK